VVTLVLQPIGSWVVEYLPMADAEAKANREAQRLKLRQKAQRKALKEKKTEKGKQNGPADDDEPEVALPPLAIHPVPLECTQNAGVHILPIRTALRINCLRLCAGDVIYVPAGKLAFTCCTGITNAN
jgi:hypothetical protein